MKNSVILLFISVVGGGFFLIRDYFLSTPDKGNLLRVDASDSDLNTKKSSFTSDYKVSTTEKNEAINLTASEIESFLKKTNAIERLNANQVDNDERSFIKQQLKALDELRTQEIEEQLALLQKELAKVEEHHLVRLKTFIER
jgi:flagellar motor component MotA